MKRVLCALLLATVLLPLPTRADVIVPGQIIKGEAEYKAFTACYGAELTGWDSAFDRVFDGVEQVVLWRYPGSGEVVYTFGVETGWFTGEDGRAKPLETCYVDSSGRVWGYLNYVAGTRYTWVCLSDPANAALAADPDIIRAVEAAMGPPVVLITAIVMGVALGTGVLLYVFWYRKKKRTR